jgi:hypothetical protein
MPRLTSSTFSGDIARPVSRGEGRPSRERQTATAGWLSAKKTAKTGCVMLSEQESSKSSRTSRGTPPTRQRESKPSGCSRASSGVESTRTRKRSQGCTRFPADATRATVRYEERAPSPSSMRRPGPGLLVAHLGAIEAVREVSGPSLGDSGLSAVPNLIHTAA